MSTKTKSTKTKSTKAKSTKAKSTKVKSKKVKKGQMVSVHYVGTFDDGTEFDNSRVREEGVSFELGSGELITGFETAVTGMKVGDVKKVKLDPEEAYGEVNPGAFQTVSHTKFPPEFEFEVDGMVRGQDHMGQAVVARIDKVNEDTVVLDFNHPLAGKSLNFEIELLDVK